MKTYKAEVELLSSGGRRGKISSGYRCDARLGDIYTGVSLTLVDREDAFPGDRFEGLITFANPGYVAEFLKAGSEFELVEGPTVVGKVVLLRYSHL